MASKTASDSFDGITGAEDGLAPMAGAVVGPWNHGRSTGFVNVLVVSGASGHYFDEAIIPGLRDRLDSYQVLDVPRKLQPPVRDNWTALRRDCSVTSSSTANEFGVRSNSRI